MFCSSLNISHSFTFQHLHIVPLFEMLSSLPPHLDNPTSPLPLCLEITSSWNLCLDCETRFGTYFFPRWHYPCQTPITFLKLLFVFCQKDHKLCKDRYYNCLIQGCDMGGKVDILNIVTWINISYMDKLLMLVFSAL